VGQQDHQHPPAALDTALAQLVSQLRAGELSSARLCLRDGGDRLVDRAHELIADITGQPAERLRIS
jgi:hypothetical protein